MSAVSCHACGAGVRETPCAPGLAASVRHSAGGISSGCRSAGVRGTPVAAYLAVSGHQVQAAAAHAWGRNGLPLALCLTLARPLVA